MKNRLKRLRYKIARRKNKTHFSLSIVKKRYYSINSKINKFNYKYLLIILSLVIFLFLFLIVLPNFQAYNSISFKYNSLNNKYAWPDGSNLNIALFGISKVGEYEFVDYLSILNISESKKFIKVLNIDTNFYLENSSLGKRVNLRQLYQLSKIKKDEINYLDLLIDVEKNIGIKIDKYIVLKLTSFEKIVDNWAKFTVYISNDIKGFSKGNISLNSKNLTFFMQSVTNSVNKLDILNDVLKSVFQKISDRTIFFSLKNIKDIISSEVDSNIDDNELKRLVNDIQIYKYSFNKTSDRSFKISDSNSSGGVKNINHDVFDEQVKSLLADDQIKLEQARVEIQNASSANGLASYYFTLLSLSGFNVIRIGNFDLILDHNVIYISDSIKFQASERTLKKIFPDAELRYSAPTNFTTADILVLVVKK